MTVANLFARIGIKADTDKAKEFSGAMKGVASDLKTAALGAVAFTAAVVASMKGALDTAKVYRDFQNESGASTDELQRWQAVAAGANVSTSDLSEAVKGLAQNREKIKLGQGNMSGFAFLGINPMDDPFSILDQLRTKTAGLPQAMKANLLSQMGVSSQFLQILNLTNGEFDRMRSNAFVIPPSAFAAMNAMQGSLNGLGKMFQWFQALLAERLAPIIDKVVKQVTAWVVVNKNGLIDGIVKGTQFIIKFVEAIVNVATWIGRIVNNTIGWKGALAALIVVWGLFNTALLMSPITWIIAGIIALVLVLDDLHAALGIDGDTRKSFFGGVFQKFPEIKKVFDGLFDGLKIFGSIMGDMFKGNMQPLDDAIKKWGILGGVIWSIVEVFKVLGSLVSLNFQAFGTLFDMIGKVGQGDFAGALKAGGDWFGKVGALVDDVTKDISGKHLDQLFADPIAKTKQLLGITDQAQTAAPELAAKMPSWMPATGSSVKVPVSVTVTNYGDIKNDIKVDHDGQRMPAQVAAQRVVPHKGGRSS